MGWLIVLTFRHAYEYVSALVTGFFLVGPFLAIGLYALSRRRERGRAGAARPDARRVAAERRRDRHVRAGARRDPARLGAGVADRVRAVLHERDADASTAFSGRSFSLDNLEFLFAYFCVGGFFAVLVFAISVVSVPMMLDRDTDGIVAVLTSLRRSPRTCRR